MRKHAIERGLIEKSGRNWQPKASLHRQVALFSKGKALTLIVPDAAAASEVGAFHVSGRRVSEQGDARLLAPFVDKSVRDTAGKTHPFETNPNTLYRLSAGGERSFEEIYRIVL